MKKNRHFPILLLCLFMLFQVTGCAPKTIQFGMVS